MKTLSFRECLIPNIQQSFQVAMIRDTIEWYVYMCWHECFGDVNLLVSNASSFATSPIRKWTWWTFRTQSPRLMSKYGCEVIGFYYQMRKEKNTHYLQHFIHLTAFLWLFL